MLKTDLMPLLKSVLPVLMVICIICMRVMRHAVERAEERDNAVRGGDFLCEYREFGGIADREVALTLTSDSAGTRMAVVERAGPDEEQTRAEYALPAFAKDKLVELYLDRGVYELKDLKRSELIALDAPTRKLRFRTALGEIEIDGCDELPKRCGSLFPEAKSEMEKWRSLFEQAKLNK